MPFRIDLIENYMKANGLSKSAFARKCRIGYHTLERFMASDGTLKISVLFKIAIVTKTNANELLNKVE